MRAFPYLLSILPVVPFFSPLGLQGQYPDPISSHPDFHPDKRTYWYSAITLASGAGVLFARHADPIQVSFPYTVIDDRGVRTDTVFTGTAAPYRHPTAYYLPVRFEFGDLHQFADLGITLTLVGSGTRGGKYDLGYGRNVYVNLPWEHFRESVRKGLVVRFALQVSYTNEQGYNSEAWLGRIDNAGKSILALGKFSGPSFKSTDNYGEFSRTQTYSTQTLDVGYSQSEIALMPCVMIASNPYRHLLHWQAELGYNIPWIDHGGIRLIQDAGNNESQGDGAAVKLNDPGLGFRYNGQAMTRTPYRFSGFYAGVSLSMSFWKKRDRRRHPTKRKTE